MKKNLKKFFDYLKKHIKGINRSIRLIRKKSSKSRIVLFFDMWWSYIRYGVNYDEYRIFEFYLIPGYKRDTYMSECRHQNLEKHLCDKKHLAILNSREKFYIKFKESLNREFYNIKEMSFKEFEELALKKKELVCRSNNLKGEAGTLTLNVKNFRSPAFLLDKAKKCGLNIVEASIKQNKIFESINPYNMNTVSVVTLLCGNKVDIVSSYVKFGITEEDKYDVNSVKHVTGIVDIKTGTIKHKLVSGEDEVYSEHPISKVKLVGLEIPLFDEIKKVASACALEFDEALEVEWNFVISNTKVYLINANLWDDYVFAQLPMFSKNKIGLMPYYRDNVKKRRI